MKNQDIFIEIQSNNSTLIPNYETCGSAGMDLRANISSPIEIEHGTIHKISTGIKLGIPEGIEAQIRSRSGLSSKGIIVVNSPATIDSDYTGECFVLITNLSKKNFYILPNMRIAQIVFSEYKKICFIDKETISKKTERGDKGFGHTGLI